MLKSSANFDDALVRQHADLLIHDLAEATQTDPARYRTDDPTVWADARWVIVHRADKTDRYPITVAAFSADNDETVRTIQAVRAALAFVTETAKETAR